MRLTKIHTTIRCGLPVIAAGYVTLASPPLSVPGEAVAVLCPGWGDGVDDVRLCFLSGHEIQFGIDSADMRRVEDELIDEARCR